MARADSPMGDRAFAGSIPEVYDRLLVPLIFEHYAADLARRVTAATPLRVLEVACGTGVLTRHLAAALPSTASIVATDLNAPMLERARQIGTARAVEWRVADALDLPFEDASFDAVVCQFGVMFFPDKPRAYAQARRILRPQGRLFFNVWDRIEHNDFAQLTELALAALFPANPPRFMSRTPHGYWERNLIERDLAAAGFKATPEIYTLAGRSRASSPRVPAMAFCHGTPLRNEIEARDSSRLDEATEAAAALIAQRFGASEVDGRMQAHVLSVAR